MTISIADALVLIVDDNPKNIQVISNILNENGLKAAVAQNGKQTLEFFKKKQPDLVLMDITIPEMDGLETCQHLKENETTCDVPVIFLTALSGTDSIVQAFEAGGVDYITKPFVKEEVLARIKVHLRLKLAMERLASMSVTDEMTGVFNRRYAYEILAREMSVAKRDNRSFVLSFVDVDNLKKINDTYGHDAGDQLINEVVAGFQATMRASDYLFRMGGDEFLLLLLNTRIEDAYSLVNRLNEKMKQKDIHGIPIDFSFGFAMYSPKDNIAPDQLIKEADQRMYEQKVKKKSHRK